MERLVGDVIVKAELKKEVYLFLIFAIYLRLFNRVCEHTPILQLGRLMLFVKAVNSTLHVLCNPLYYWTYLILPSPFIATCACALSTSKSHFRSQILIRI